MKTVALAVDVGDEASVADAVAATVAELGAIDTVVASAGIALAGTTDSLTLEEWETVIRINLTGTFLTLKHTLPHLCASGRGAIVTIGSVASIVAAGRVSSYDASKGGVLQLTRAVAVEYADRGVRANCVCPGVTADEPRRDQPVDHRVDEDDRTTSAACAGADGPGGRPRRACLRRRLLVLRRCLIRHRRRHRRRRRVHRSLSRTCSSPSRPFSSHLGSAPTSRCRTCWRPLVGRLRVRRARRVERGRAPRPRSLDARGGVHARTGRTPMLRRAATRRGRRHRQHRGVRLSTRHPSRPATEARLCGAALGPDIEDPRDPRVRDRLRRCADILAGAGVRLAIEFLPYSCVPTVADAFDLCDAVGWDAAGLLVDSWHTCVTGQVGELAELSATDIAMVQYSDGTMPEPGRIRQDSRNHRRLPGQGEFDLAGFVAAVVATGYTGIVSPEVLSGEVRAAPPGPFAADVHRALRDDWGSAIT